MKRAVSVLGSTGSIGRQTLDVADKLNMEVCALSADKNVELLEEQIRKYKPAVAAVNNEEAARDIKARVADTSVKIIAGMSGLIEAARIKEAETVVTGIAGTDGLQPTLAAIREGKRVAVANKETLVCAGELVMRAAEEYGAEIIPVDSEHSAIFQCLNRNEGAVIKQIILTGSGGPFRGKSRDEIGASDAKTATKHPRWSMGRKVSLDSATLMNKGFEFIEAMYLFSVTPEQIRVVIHPESIIHSMVEFQDKTVIAQLSHPDMRLPIQYALTYPERYPSPVASLDFATLGALTFENPDLEEFPCLALAMQVAEHGTLAGAALSGADDAAADLFLLGKIGFNDIYTLVHGAVERVESNKKPSLDDVISVITDARRYVYEASAKFERVF